MTLAGNQNSQLDTCYLHYDYRVYVIIKKFWMKFWVNWAMYLQRKGHVYGVASHTLCSGARASACGIMRASSSAHSRLCRGSATPVGQ